MPSIQSHTTRTTMKKDQGPYTPQEFRELIKTSEKQQGKRKKKAPNLQPYMCTYDGPYNDGPSAPSPSMASLVVHGFMSPLTFGNALPQSLGTPAFAISLPGIGPSLNQIWSKSLSVRDLYKIKKSWRTCTHLWLKQYNKDVLLGKYVSFFIGQFEHGRNMYDSLNLAATAKIIEDALTKKNPFDADSVALIDDNPDIIESTTCIPWRASTAGLGSWSHLFIYQIG